MALPPGYLANLRAAYVQFSPADLVCAAESFSGSARAELEGRAWAAWIEQQQFALPPAPRSRDLQDHLDHLRGPVRQEYERWQTQLQKIAAALSRHPEGPGRLAAETALLRRWLDLPRPALPKPLELDYANRTAFHALAEQLFAEHLAEARFSAVASALRLASRAGTGFSLDVALGNVVAPTHRLVRPSEPGQQPLPRLGGARGSELRRVALSVLPEPHFAHLFEPHGLEDARALRLALFDTPEGRAFVADQQLRLALFHRHHRAAQLAAALWSSSSQVAAFDRELFGMLMTLPVSQGIWPAGRTTTSTVQPESPRQQLNASLLFEAAAPERSSASSSANLRPEEAACFKDTLDFLRFPPPCVGFSWSTASREVYARDVATNPLSSCEDVCFSVLEGPSRFEYLPKPSVQENKACTKRACPQGARIVVQGPFVDEQEYEISLDARGYTSRCRILFRRGGGKQECTGPLSTFLGSNTFGFRIFEKVDSAELQVAVRGEPLFGRHLELSWGYVEPNGPGCGNCLSGYVKQVAAASDE